MRKEASLQQWKELYEVTLNLKAVRIWWRLRSREKKSRYL